MVTLTKQDVQSVIDNARNRLLNSVASRQDIQALQETIKMLTNTLQQSQQLLRQGEYQRVQLVRRAVAMESRMVQLESELRSLRTAMIQLSQVRPTERVTERVIMAAEREMPDRQAPGQTYVYNPSPAS
jgi:hypothetical protein